MTDITINIKTGSENSEPKITATTGNAKDVVPNTETPLAELPTTETPKEEMKEEMKEDVASEKPPTKEKSSDKDDSQKMDMTKEEHAKMGSKK